MLCIFLAFILNVSGFSPVHLAIEHATVLCASKGFGGSGFGGSASSSKKSKKQNKKKKANKLKDTLADKPKDVNTSSSKNLPFVKSEQDALLETLAAKASNTCIGKAVASSPLFSDEMDPFWGLMPSLINSRFPNVPDGELERVAGMIRHTLDPNLPIDDDVTMNDH